MKKLCMLFAAVLFITGMAAQAFAGVSSINNNFTMLAPDGGLTGGTNDVVFTWDETKLTSVAASGQVSNATLTSTCPFFGIPWSAHDVAIYGPGTYTVYADCPAGSPGCGAGTPITFTVGAGQLGVHILFDWGGNNDIDVVDVWVPNAVFGASPMCADASNCGGQATCGSNAAGTVWGYMSSDWNGDGINGSPMVDGPFAGFNANFNVKSPAYAKNNFTMIAPDGGLTGGTNDVVFTWNRTTMTSVAASGQVSNATLSSVTPFFGVNWTAHDVAIYGPGTYTVYADCPAGSPGCGAGAPITFTVGAGQLGAHILFDWGGSNDIDVVDVWVQNSPFGPSPLYTGPDGGTADPAMIWTFMSSDWNGDGMNGYPMVDGPFLGFNANFNVILPVCNDCGNCDDNNACTTDTFTPTGVCAHTPISCDDNNICTIDSCNPANGCVHTPTVPAQCNDNNICTLDGCTNNACTHTVTVPVSCNDNNICTLDGCTNNACTHVATIPAAANDNNICTSDGCTNNVFTHTPTVPASCNDNNACTVDGCSNNACTHTAVMCDDRSICTTDTCDTAKGCIYTPSTPSCCVTPSNNNFTMVDPTGKTIGGTNNVLFSWDGSKKTSVAASGQISNAVISSTCPFQGITWSAHDVAIYGPGSYTVYAGCAAGSPGCGTGTAIIFSVGANQLGVHMLFNWGASSNIDVVNVWSPAATFAPSALWTGVCGSQVASKVWDLMSSDWNNDGKNGYPMVDGPFLNFSANFNIMAGGCGGCIPANCDDNNACTADSCVAGTCVHSPIDCNDNNLCTIDSCNPATGCRHDETLCNTGYCNPSTGFCVDYCPIPCNDNNACTIDTCQIIAAGEPGICVYTPITCNDNNACTTDTCNTSTGCVYTPIVCNDNNACTIDSCNTATGCVYTPISCSDNDSCTTDSCDPATGCVHTAITGCSASWIITTLAGNGAQGYSGDNGPATAASLADPFGVDVDSSGNVYIADHSRIRKVDVFGTITTVAGNSIFGGYTGDNGPATAASLNDPYDVAVDSSGNIYIADSYNYRVRKVDTSGIITTVAGNGTVGYSGDNGPATSASFNNPSGVAVDSSGNIYVADIYNNRIRKIDTAGIITTVAGSGSPGYSGDNGPATSANLYWPRGVTVDSAGNIYIADTNNGRIRKVGASGLITTVAGGGTQLGDNGPATSASLGGPSSAAVDSSGNIYIACTDNRIRKVDTSGIITTAAGNGTQGYSGDNGPATSASLAYPSGVALDSRGSIYIADSYNNRIRKVASSVSTCTGQPDGTPCNDNNACTSNDVCSNGTCVGTPVNCDDNNICTTDSCNTATGCVHTATVPASCNDNNPCTIDSCNTATGACVHTPKCNDFNPCTIDTCDTATGNCVFTTAPEGTSCDEKCPLINNCGGVCISGQCQCYCCDDNNACTSDSFNTATGCVHTPINCNDNNACTTDSCNTATGCVHTPIANCCTSSAQCNDNNVCTTDACVNNVCVHTLDNGGLCCPCDLFPTCNPISGCPEIPCGSSCNDNNACTADSCNPVMGFCVYTPINCNDNNACTADSCDPVKGCAHTAISCDDRNACTTDSCNPATGCVNTNICTSYQNNNFTMLDPAGNLAGGTNDVTFAWDGTMKTSVAASGQIGNATLSSTCPFFGVPWSAHDLAIYGPGTYTVYSGCPAGSPGCGIGAPINFTVGAGEIAGHLLFNYGPSTDIDVVNVWSPHAVFGPSALWTGACGSNPAGTTWAWMSSDFDSDGINGSGMVDGPFTGFNANFNLISECACSKASCDDNNACTIDVCSCEIGCTHTPIACNDNNACTTDICNPAIGCVHTQIICNPPEPPSDSCILTSCDPVRGCIFTLLSCNDNNACTIDTCSDATGCVHKPIICTDNNACTVDTCDLVTGCKYTPINCNDNNACTNDGCDTVTGCTHTAVACNDNNACTSDSCNPATGCVFTPLPIVSDKNPCTNDSCDPATGLPVYTPNTAPCDDGLFCNGTDTCSGGTCSVHSGNPCPSGTSCDEVTDQCTCQKSVTIRGGGQKPNGVDLQIQTKFTVINGGCILDSTNSSITVSCGSIVTIDWHQGTGPNPTSVTWNGVSVPMDTPFTTGQTGKLVLTNTAALGGKDTDRITINCQ